MKTKEQQAREWLRKQQKLRSNIPVLVVQGNHPPFLMGEHYFFTTPAGQYCYYPSAYRKRFGRPIYHPSTLRIEVGEEWTP